VAEVAAKVMSAAPDPVVEMKVPLVVEAKAAKSWAEAHSGSTRGRRWRIRHDFHGIPGRFLYQSWLDRRPPVTRRAMTDKASKPANPSAKQNLDPTKIAPFSHDRAANAAQEASPSYRLAALDTEWLLADAQHGMRFMLEYEKSNRSWTPGRALDRGCVRLGALSPTGSPDHVRWYNDARTLPASHPSAAARC